MSGRNTESAVEPDIDIVETRASHDRLMRTVERLDDATMTTASQLPG